MSSIGIIGAGAWGTALAIHALRAGNAVTLVARSAEAVDCMRQTRENSRLPGVLLPEPLKIVREIPHGLDLQFWVVPTQYMRGAMDQLGCPDVPIIVCAKGVEAGTHLLPLEIAADVAPERNLAVLTGPNFAHEVARGMPAATVIASKDRLLRERIRDAIGTATFRLYGNDDPLGTQLGGAAKNVIAIAAGAVMGAGLGENARAALITRGLSELGRLTMALGGRLETVMGLSGLGDLLLTCTGRSSRNFSLGYTIGQSGGIGDISTGYEGVAEGVATAPALVARAGAVDMPICRAVASLLTGATSFERAIEQLLSRPQRDE